MATTIQPAAGGSTRGPKRGAEKAARAKADRKGEKQPKAAGSAKPLTEAEKKVLAKREAGRRAKQAGLTAKKVWRWKVNRLRCEIARMLPLARDPWCDRDDVFDRVALYLSVCHSTWSMGSTSSSFYRGREDREKILARLLKTRVGKSPWLAIAALAGGVAEGTAKHVAAAIFWQAKDGPRIDIPDADVVGIADLLAIDLAALWKIDQKGQWGKEYFALHTREQLVVLRDELKCVNRFSETRDRATMVRCLMDAGSNLLLPLPKELARTKRPG